MFRNLIEEIDAIIARDPSAHSRFEVIMTYPGLHAMLFYRIGHCLWLANWRILSRWIAYIGRFFTGIEIHPAAKIGRRLFIDHGSGVVIGQTAIVGDDVTLYHSVTLGAKLPAVESRKQVGVKRHPTIENGVIIGAGAQVLGAVTIGHDCQIAANAVVLQDIKPYSIVGGIPGVVIGMIKKNGEQE